MALNAIAEILAEYIIIYSNQPGWNLTWHLYRENNNFDVARQNLVNLYPDSTNDLNQFFSKIIRRVDFLKLNSSYA